jgi:hypothetical protein
MSETPEMLQNSEATQPPSGFSDHVLSLPKCGSDSICSPPPVPARIAATPAKTVAIAVTARNKAVNAGFLSSRALSRVPC